MEVGDQTVDHLKFIAWIDENFSPATSGFQDSILTSCRLQCTAAGSSNCDHTSAIFLGIVDQLRLVFFHNVKFRMHVMLFYIIYFNRTESSKTYVKRYMGNIYALGFHLFQKFFGEMQTCCRSCCGTLILCINSLVAILIL